MNISQLSTLSLNPIGIVHSHQRLKFEAHSQVRDNVEVYNTVELFPKRNLESGLRDLQGFERIWLIWWFHKNKNWKPLVRPPRGKSVKRGVFATRSPHRPSPIGMSAVRLYSVTGLTLTVGDVDLIDGTPILDIKPYVSNVDAFPNSAAGWLDELEDSLPDTPVYKVDVSPLANEQLRWLNTSWNIDFLNRAKEILEIDPKPHKTRRISRAGEYLKMGCGAWRLLFKIQDKQVYIEKVDRGFTDSQLQNPKFTQIPDREAQIAFKIRFPS